jgi:antitoxin HicB
MKTKHSIIIQWNEEDKVFVATVPEIEGLNAFGNTPEKAIKELNEAKELFIETMQEDYDSVPEPDLYKQHSGQLRIRIPKSLHASLSLDAKKEDISLNTYIVHLLSERNQFSRIKAELAAIRASLIDEQLRDSVTTTAETYFSLLKTPEKSDKKPSAELVTIKPH